MTDAIGAPPPGGGEAEDANGAPAGARSEDVVAAPAGTEGEDAVAVPVDQGADAIAAAAGQDEEVIAASAGQGEGEVAPPAGQDEGVIAAPAGQGEDVVAAPVDARNERPVGAADRAGADTEVVNPPPREPDEAALRLAEAAVFASVTPMSARGLSQILPNDMDAAAVIAALRERHAGRGIELVEIGGGLQFRTAADLAPQLRKVVQVARRLPRVALETLAIVAYHQPITRPEIEDMRGTGLSQQTLDVLLENELIVARGRKETPGRPTLWGTTPKFLEYFGLRDIRELPRRQDLLLETVRPGMEGEGDTLSAPVAERGEPGAPPHKH